MADGALLLPVTVPALLAVSTTEVRPSQALVVLSTSLLSARAAPAVARSRTAAAITAAANATPGTMRLFGGVVALVDEGGGAERHGVPPSCVAYLSPALTVGSWARPRAQIKRLYAKSYISKQKREVSIRQHQCPTKSPNGASELTR